jgi:hypothetical protein
MHASRHLNVINHTTAPMRNTGAFVRVMKSGRNEKARKLKTGKLNDFMLANYEFV